MAHPKCDDCDRPAHYTAHVIHRTRKRVKRFQLHGCVNHYDDRFTAARKRYGHMNVVTMQAEDFPAELKKLVKKPS